MGNDEKNSRELRGQKPFFVKRLWNGLRSIDWGNPLNKWKLLLFSVITFFAIAGSTYGAIAGTSTTSFCSGCHEMSPEYVTHLSTTHSEIKCAYCHIQPGLTNTIKGKMAAMTEVYHHVTRTQPDPIFATKVVEDVVCLRCHSENRDVTPTGDLIVNHGGHIDEGIACITCHAGVAHAKIVERGLNTSDTYDYWVMENADKLLSQEYIRPNMGTCIDCHDQVNQGLRPWEDKYYLLSEAPSNLDETFEHTYSSQVLQQLGSQMNNVELSMECATCHLEEDVPKNHTNKDWNDGHGKYAIEQLDQCLTCHAEEKWVKRVQEQNIQDLLSESVSNLDFYVPDIHVVRNETRSATFCFTCHSERPTGHQTSDEWLTGHANFANTTEQINECLVCHDNQKEEFLAAPTDVYCEFCHRTGLKDY